MNISAKTVIFIVGPTAVGKSDYAVRLALENGGEIISADSMQVYKGLDLGTAKPSIEEKMGVPHHMIDIVDPRSDYSVGEYSKEAGSIIERLLSKRITPIVCGGSGLYIHSLLYELDFSGSSRNDSLRSQLEDEAERLGTEHLYKKLLEIDPSVSESIHPNNKKRVIRALERVYGEIENEGMRDFDKTFSIPRSWSSKIIRLTADRNNLYKKIEERADVFFVNGLIDEVRGLLENGVSRNSTAMQGIGYKEVVCMLGGRCTKEDAVDTIKRNTRRYAKRQWTWFRAEPDMQWLDMHQPEAQQEALAIANEFLKNGKE